MKEAVVTKHAPGAIGPYSQGITLGNLVFTSGQLPVNASTGEMPDSIEEQTKQSLENVKAVLTSAGSSMDRILKVTVYLKDMNEFSKMNEIYDTFFEGIYPSRSAVEVARLPMDAKVEIEVIAYK